MNKLQQEIERTQYTTEDWKGHEKVEQNCNLCDIQEELNYRLEQKEITKKEYNYLCNHYDTILHYYEDNIGNDDTWHISLDCAIDGTLELMGNE